jgi:hypothetical protein
MMNRPPAHSPLKSLAFRVLIWVAVPTALGALVYALAALQPTVQGEANQAIKQLDLSGTVREQNRRALQGLK